VFHGKAKTPMLEGNQAKDGLIRCQKCKQILANIKESGYIQVKVHKGKSRDIRYMTTNSEVFIHCQCNYSGLYTVNHGWTETRSLV